MTRNSRVNVGRLYLARISIFPLLFGSLQLYSLFLYQLLMTNTTIGLPVRKLDHNRPDIVIVDKQKSSCLIINVACPSDWRVDIKQEDKINKYLDLGCEIKELWEMKKVKVIPIVIGALGTVLRRLEDYLRNIKCWDRFGSTAKNSPAGISKNPPKSP